MLGEERVGALVVGRLLEPDRRRGWACGREWDRAFRPEQLLGEAARVDDVQLASLVVDHGQGRGAGADGLERLVEERRGDLRGRQRSGEGSRERLEATGPTPGELGLHPRRMLALVQVRALERLRCVPGDGLDETPRSLVGNALWRVAGDEQPDGVALHDQRDDREDAVVLLAPRGRGRHPSVVGGHPLRVVTAPSACGIRCEECERRELALVGDAEDDGGLGGGDRLHALRDEGCHLRGRRRRAERHRDGMELGEVAGEPLGPRAGDLLRRLGTSTLALLDHEAGVVCEPPHQREQLGRRIRDDARPAEREEQLGPSRDDDRHAEDGPDALLQHALERLPGDGRSGVAEECRVEPFERALHPGVVTGLDDMTRWSPLVGWIAPDHLQPAVAGLPQLRDVRVEHLARLLADRGHDLALRCVHEPGDEARDALERVARASLALVGERALEGLPAQLRCDLREREHVLVDGVRSVEREPDRAGDPPLDAKRDGEGRCGVARELRAVRERLLERGTRHGVGGLPRTCCLGDRRTRREREAQSRPQDRARPSGGRDDHEVVALDETERPSYRAEQGGDACEKRAGHVGGLGRGCQCPCERVQLGGDRARRLGLRRATALLLAEPLERPARPDEHERDRQSDRPPRRVRPALRPGGPAGLHQGERDEKPADRGCNERRADAAVDGDDHDGPDERREQDVLVRERRQEPGEKERDADRRERDRIRAPAGSRAVTEGHRQTFTQGAQSAAALPSSSNRIPTRHDASDAGGVCFTLHRGVSRSWATGIPCR